jgi:MFS family permease
MLYGATMMILYQMSLLQNDRQCMFRFYRFSALLVGSVVVCLVVLCLGCTKLIFSGVGSDFLAKVLKASRLWCLTIASVIFLIAQTLALNIQNPNFLSIVSSLTGLAYGFLFGCFPSLVAEAFGVHGLSTNWGFMTLSPIITGNIFNLSYGMFYDGHSILKPGGERVCTEGLACYRAAYTLTFVSCLVALVVSLWSIWYTHNLRLQEEKSLSRVNERHEHFISEHDFR